jgi:hypothetical protein
LFAAIPAFAAPFPGASGMAQLDATHYLCVQDRKADQPGACLGVLAVHPQAEAKRGQPVLTYAPLEVHGWQGDRASDIESVCPLPGDGSLFLACESGYWQGRYGRLFELRVTRGKHGWSARLERTLQLPELPDEVEGLACQANPAGRVLLLLGERGGRSPGDSGRLDWGWLDELAAAQQGAGRPAQGWQFTSADVSNPFGAYPQARAVSDLYLDPDGMLWVASAYDPDADCGPFASCVWDLATVDASADAPEEQVAMLSTAAQDWLMEGLKIEALGPPCLEGAVLSVATDDEGYGGVWRPLGTPTDILQGSDDSGSGDESGSNPAPDAAETTQPGQ